MRYLIGILMLTTLLSCTVSQSQQAVEPEATVTTPAATPTPAAYNAASSLSRSTKNEIPSAAKRIIDRAEKLEIILINPVGGTYHPNVEYKLNSPDRYYGYEMLGKALVSDVKARELRESLYSGVAVISMGESAMCFSPRHGLRAAHGGKTAELLICFHCMNFYTYTADGQRHPPMNAISREAQPVFNRLLKEAGIQVR